MAVGLSAANANAFLNWLCRGTAMGTAPTAFWIQLHTADPGAAGTTAAAGNATRKQVTFGTNASGGTISNTVAVTWSTSEVDTAEDYTHWTAWDASTAGTFEGSGLITANAVIVGDEFTIPVGDLDLAFTVAA